MRAQWRQAAENLKTSSPRRNCCCLAMWTVGRERKESGQGVSNGGFEVKDDKEEKIMKKAEPHLVLLVV